MDHMATLPDAPLTEEQYLRIEREAELRVSFTMGGCMRWRAARQSFADRGFAFAPCSIGRTGAMPDLQLRYANQGGSGRLYTYPDCSVVCGTSNFQRPQDVSQSSADCSSAFALHRSYDRGKNLRCTEQSKFREYLLIHQTGGMWSITLSRTTELGAAGTSGVEGGFDCAVGATISLGDCMRRRWISLKTSC